MHVRLLLVSGLLAGCGGKVIDASLESDAGASDGAIADVAVVDSRPPSRPDSAPPPPPPKDSGPLVCDAPLAGFTCPAVAPAKGAKTCTDAAIQALVDGCFGETATSDGCEAARSKHPACEACALGTFLVDGAFIDMSPCMAKVKPASTCAKSIRCLYGCFDARCGACDRFSSGPDGASEWEACLERASYPDGACQPYGGDEYEPCLTDADLRVCVPYDVPDLLPFYRGACRDGGDWSKAYVPDGTLGG